MKKILAIALSLMIFSSMVGCGSSSSKTVPSVDPTSSAAPESTQDSMIHPKMALSLGTGPSGSANYAAMSSIANLISKRYPNYTFNPEISTGSAQNVRMIEQGVCQIGVCMADAAYAAYNGEREFDDTTKEKINFVMSGYETIFNQFLPKDSDIKTFTDLKGKKCGVANGTMLQSYWPMLLEMHGMTENDVQTVGLSFGDIINGISDGTLDYGIHVTSMPNSNLSDLALTKGIKMLGFEEDIIKKITEKYFYFKEAIIPKDVYKLDADVITIGTRNTIIASPDLDAQVVYDFLDVVLSSEEDLKLVSPSAAAFNKENALLYSDLIPMHPGAEKYYKENGMIP